jgi:hypothetical protein
VAGAAGPVRLWVPAARGRDDAFGPNADLRGPGDLPVLVVDGRPGELAAAVAALGADLADALVDVVGPNQPEPAAAEPVPLADRSVALLNRGTPGCVVTPDGTLHMSLMRSCSAWPSGIWIDGDRRTAPDGSSFAWQHWSHTFEYALASGSGDWRSAGFVSAAEEYNHELVTVTAGGAGLAAVEPLVAVEAGNVTVGAVKPWGNPLAAGRVPAAYDAEEALVTVRLRETAGHAGTARVRLAGSVSGAWLTDLLEESRGAALPVKDGAVVVDMPAFGTVTMMVRAGRPGGTLAPSEPVQPAYARYWLHGKGPAPAGNLPVAVHLSPVRVALAEAGAAGGSAGLRLTVGCGAEAASGAVELTVPGELTVNPAGPFRYELAPGGYAAWDLTVRAAPETGNGRYFLAARIGDGLDGPGLVIEDAAMVAVGERRWPDPDLPPEETLELLQADYMASAAEVELAVLTPELRLAPGGRAELAVSVTSGLASELRGEAQLVSPFGCWDLLAPWTQGFRAAPGEPVVLRFDVLAPAAARHGTWWALVKIMYFGRVRYTDAVPVIVGPAR